MFLQQNLIHTPYGKDPIHPTTKPRGGFINLYNVKDEDVCNYINNTDYSVEYIMHDGLNSQIFIFDHNEYIGKK